MSRQIKRIELTKEEIGLIQVALNFRIEWLLDQDDKDCKELATRNNELVYKVIGLVGPILVTLSGGQDEVI